MKLGIVHEPQLSLGLEIGPEWVRPLRAKLRYLGEVLHEGRACTVSRYELECGHVVERFERTPRERLRCDKCEARPRRQPVETRRPRLVRSGGSTR